jgi:protein-arginine kinase activator protein McsA
MDPEEQIKELEKEKQKAIERKDTNNAWDIQIKINDLKTKRN